MSLLFLLPSLKVKDKHNPIKAAPDSAKVAELNPVAVATCAVAWLFKAFSCDADMIPINNAEPIAADSCCIVFIIATPCA